MHKMLYYHIKIEIVIYLFFQILSAYTVSSLVVNHNSNHRSGVRELRSGYSVLGARHFGFSKFLPNLFDLLKIKKNLIAAYPFELAASAIDMFCSSTLFMHRVPQRITPDINYMHFQFITPCQNFSVPILEAEKLWNLSEFDKTKKVVILATGWTNTVNDSETLFMLSKAFLCRNDVNFIIVDVASYVDTLYTWAALNTDGIGEHIAVGLSHLEKLIPLDRIHLIGHSLGAHIMGKTGRTFFKLTGKQIPRITGLDPAKPCFLKNNTLNSLRQSDAQFVDVIHTNIGILAKRYPLGDMDFYPGGANALPPGCLTIACAHSRAVEYFAESVYPENEQNFLASRCDSWQELKRQTCDDGEKVWMGYNAKNAQSGIYYVDVNWRAPFGKFAKESQDMTEAKICHLCQD